MVKVQLELTEKANMIVDVFKAKNKIKLKEEAINSLIELNGDVL